MFSYFFGTFLVGLARAIWLIRRPETVFPVDRSVKFSQSCRGEKNKSEFKNEK